MKQHLNILRATRHKVAEIVDKLSLAQLNTIPEGFNNNLIWNFGHIIITQQLLCYKLSGLECNVQEELLPLYRKGSRPEKPVGQAEFEYLRAKLDETILLLERDLKSGNFESYSAYSTSYGVTLNSSIEAIIFNNVHEALHLGTMTAMRKLV